MKEYIVFTIGMNKKLAKDFAKFWNCQMGKVTSIKYPDGNELMKTETNVADKDIIIIDSVVKKPNDVLYSLIMLIESMRRGKARSITLVIPYLSYPRQNNLDDPAEPISAELTANIIENAKYDKLMSFDLHHSKDATYFKRGIKNIPTTEIFSNYYLKYFEEKGVSSKNVVVVAPNLESTSRVDRLIFSLRGAKKVVMDKNKTIDLKADVENKTCIIIDDVIYTGATIAKTAKTLYKNGAKEVLVGASHGVFAKGAVEKIKEAGVKDIAITNTIEQVVPSGVKCLDVSYLIIQNM